MDLTELRYQDPRTLTYLGSPSLLRLPDGALLAAHDYFGPGCPRNHENEEHLASIYRSENDGVTWSCITHIANAYWSTLFFHGGAVHLLGTSQQYGSIVIRRSMDGGYTWTHPANENCGLLFRGGFYHKPPNYHCAPVPVLETQGRIYRAFEDCDPCVWGSGFKSAVISADEKADFLKASSWTMSNKLAFDPAWIPSGMRPNSEWGWLEGNMVETPDGELRNILRLHSWMPGKAAMATVSPDGRKIIFSPSSDFICFPGHHSKFTIRRDPVTGLYVTLVNATEADPNYGARNVLSLSISEGLRSWKVVETLLGDDLGLSEQESRRNTGFQYADWQFDGDDLVCLVRTAYKGAHNFHDSNRITFHRFCEFRRHVQGRV